MRAVHGNAGIVTVEGLIRVFKTGQRGALDSYSDRALARVWKAVRFSWWFTQLMHRSPTATPFDRMMQVAELDYIKGSRPAQTALAENYRAVVGLMRAIPSAIVVGGNQGWLGADKSAKVTFRTKEEWIMSLAKLSCC